MSTILICRAARSLAYGALAVVLAQGLAARGVGASAIGALITAMLLSGALLSALSGRLVRAVGGRATYAASGAAMIGAAALLGGGVPAIVVACLLGVAFGALLAAVLSYAGVLLLYAAAGMVVVIGSALIPEIRMDRAVAADVRVTRFGTVERLAALFALDAFAGGFVVQAFLAYWFMLRFGVGPHTIGPLLFGANLLAAASLLLADRVAARIGLLPTMVFTHLPSNVLLCLVPLMPTFPL
ncbi:MAG: hypothetical protein ACHQ4H_18465, partial [Ktedonobacterales bacterium]